MKKVLPLIVICILLITSWQIVTADVQEPICDDSPKAGIVELPNQRSTVLQAEFDYQVPFCSNNIVIVATMLNGATKGEETSAKSIDTGTGYISACLNNIPAESYFVQYIAMIATEPLPTLKLGETESFNCDG